MIHLTVRYVLLLVPRRRNMKGYSVNVDAAHSKLKTYWWITISGQQDMMAGINWPRLHARGYTSKRKRAVTSTGPSSTRWVTRQNTSELLVQLALLPAWKCMEYTCLRSNNPFQQTWQLTSFSGCSIIDSLPERNRLRAKVLVVVEFQFWSSAWEILTERVCLCHSHSNCVVKRKLYCHILKSSSPSHPYPLSPQKNWCLTLFCS
jgi:hypothetical protein